MSTQKLSNSDNLLGQNIQNTRKMLGLKQYELAEKLHTSPGYISEIESGKKIPGSDFLYSLKRIFGINLDQLFEEASTSGPVASETETVEEPSVDYAKENLLLQLIQEKTDIIELLKSQVADLKADKKVLENLIADQRIQIKELKKKLNELQEAPG